MNAQHFEIVRTPDGYHGRFVAGNGEQVWTTEVLTSEANVRNAISLLAPNLANLAIVRRDARFGSSS